MSALCISTATDSALFFQKCVHYWPEKEGTYGPFAICVQGVSECVEYVVRDLSIQVGRAPSWGHRGSPAVHLAPRAPYRDGNTV